MRGGGAAGQFPRRPGESSTPLPNNAAVAANSLPRKSFQNHIKTCRSMPSIVCKFDNQNISTFKDNYRLMCDLPFATYFDFKTTCRKKLTILKRELNYNLFLILSQLLCTPTFALREFFKRGVLLKSLNS